PLHPALAAFARVTVQPGETLEKTLVLDKRAFTVVNERGERQTAAGAFEVYAGFSQPDERSRELTGCEPLRMVL
ncbi:MAG: fibronectin type III-like domain-contianing protein, partial [Blautia sp.]|nr:fibronectin type III-like domain-contianing protein [Blautia sp.]